MSTKANFGVAPRLATLLGENHRSTYQAIRELVDNAWDADAETVWISLPEPLGQQQIVVEDDGSGMTKAELAKEYLLIGVRQTISARRAYDKAPPACAGSQRHRKVCRPCCRGENLPH